MVLLMLDVKLIVRLSRWLIVALPVLFHWKENWKCEHLNNLR